MKGAVRGMNSSFRGKNFFYLGKDQYDVQISLSDNNNIHRNDVGTVEEM